jgi:tetratricopeptide (TPR) repeat protein/tRNA A-37 threonylcarbamoyl transferase component Bud32
MAPCPDEDELVELVEGRLSERDRTALDIHIDGCPTCRALVAAVAPGESAELVAAPVRSAFLRYLIIEVVGAGASGIVYAAYDPELDRKVAIKVMRSHDAANAAQDKTRLLREAQAIARLVHPNVVAVHDVGSVDDRVFLVMELVDGRTLAAWLREAPRSWREIVAVFAQAGRGLSAAHVAGLVHRDFKPENVLIGRDGRVLVTDFGLARAAGAVKEESSPISPASLLARQLTLSGVAAGTPAYMPPEQLRGEASDARSDIFSFCVALYQALHAQHPFDGETLGDITGEIESGRVRPPPRDSKVPLELHRLLVRGLSAQPEARFATLDELLAELGRDRRAALRRAAVAAALVLVAGLGGGALLSAQRQKTQLCRGAEAKLAGVWDDARRTQLAQVFAATNTPYAADAERTTRTALDDYTRRWVAMRTEACEATRVHGEQSEELLDLRVACLDGRRQDLQALVELFVHADAALVARAAAAAEALPDLDACRDTAALKSPVRLPRDPVARARIDKLRQKVAEARALTQAGRYADAAHAAAAAVNETAATGYRPLEAEARYVAGRVATETAEYDAARRHYIDAALAADAGRDDVLAAMSWARLAQTVGFHQAHYDEGLEWARYAQARLDHIGDSPRVERVLRLARGSIYADQGKLELAAAEHRRALALDEQIWGGDSIDVAETLVFLGNDYYWRGQWDEALAVYQRSLAIRGKIEGTAHAHYATALVNVGNVYYECRELAMAADYHERALPIQERALGPENPHVAGTLGNLGIIYTEQKQWDRALAALRRAIAIYEHVYGPSHPHVAFAVASLGDLYKEEGHTEVAREQYRRSLAIYTQAHGAEHPSLAPTLARLGESYLRDGAPAKAAPFLEHAVMLWQGNASSDPTGLAKARYNLGRALGDSDRRRARQLVMTARDVFVAAGTARQHETDDAEAWLLHHPARD